MVATPWGDSASLRERRLPPGPGRAAEEVKANQRERLLGAMVASVAARGYAATRVADLVELSGVSSRSFYDLFPDKEACFLATLDSILAAAGEDEGTEGDGWGERIRAAVERFALSVATQPAAARLCLLEPYAAGPEAVRLLDEANARAEAGARRMVRSSEPHAGFPEEMIKAFIGAVEEVARTRLRRGEEAELPRLVDDLAELTAGFVPPPRPLRLGERPTAAERESLDAPDHVERILRALAVVVADGGYGEATVERIVKTAGVSGSRFYAHFRDKEDAALAAIDSAGAQMVAAMMPAFRRNPEWAHGVRAALAALLNFLASRPALARLILVEAYAIGPGALQLREEALRPLALLLEGAGRAGGTPAVAFEAIAGAILHLAQERLRRVGPAGLPPLTPLCSYIALAPFVGPAAACTVANGEGDGDLRGSTSPAEIRAVYRNPVQRAAVNALSRGPLELVDLAAALRERPEVVRAELQELVESGLIERSRDRAASGEVYRFPLEAVDVERFAELDLAERQRIAAQIIRLVEHDVQRSLESGDLVKRPEVALVRLVLMLDEQGWREISALHTELMWSVLRAQEESQKRLDESGEQPIEARTVQLHFTMPP